MVIANTLRPGMRATRAFVELDAIAGNVQALRGLLPDLTKLMAVVKADGYGHGATWIARAALDAGATALGVATVGEGRVLRRHGIEAPILLLGSIDPSEAPTACEARLEITVGEPALLEAVQRAARLTSRPPVAVHLKVDTGLRRYGAMPEQARALASRIAADGALRFAGISTHFASADEPDEPFTVEQLRRFDAFLAEIRSRGIELPPVHVANSAGILTHRDAHYDMVRAGIALYGVPPSSDVPLPTGMRPAMRIESRIARLARLAEGDTVGYNRTYRAQCPTTCGLVPIGYADGYRRALSGKGWVGIRGERCPVLGRVSMDQIVVEVPADRGIQVGDTVHVMNHEMNSGAPDVNVIAALADTNSYEILVGTGRRVPRVFVRDGAIVGTSDLDGDGGTP